MKEKRLCICMNNFIGERVGGVEIQTYLIAKYLSLNGWTTFFIACTKDTNKIGRQEAYDGFIVCWAGKKGMFSFFRRDIPEWLDKIKPSIVYHRGRSALTCSPLGYRFRGKSKWARIYHCAEDNDLLRDFDFRQVQRSSKMFAKKILLLIHAILSDYFFRQTLIRSDCVIAQTEHQKDLFHSELNKKSTVIPSGHEIPSPPFVKSGVPIVFWIAHAGRRKRLELFVALARSLKDTRAEFRFAGTLPHEDYKNEVFSMIAGLSNIRYMGPLSWQESNAMFAGASVFVNTTMPGREGFPNTYIQAWFRETPVVTLDCDPDGVIEKYRLGFHSRTPDRMAEDIKKLITDENLRREMGKNARAYAVQHHDIGKTAGKLDAVCTALL